MAMRKNNAENYEVVCSLKFDRLFAEKYPIAYQAKKEELMEDCGMSEEEAVDKMKDMAVELEMYYEKGRGLFAVESEAVENTTIYSPYTKEELEECED